MVIKHIFLSGKVQNVSFRYHTFERATHLGIKGWVRNLEDGRVEVVAVAESHEAINELIKFLEVGPPAARVEDVEIEEVSGRKVSFDDFSIRRDGGPTWRD